MRAQSWLIVLLVASAGFLVSCSSTPEQLVARHTKRGDEYMRKEKYREAAIEYRNAIKAVPNDGSLHWKLAQAALEAKDLRTAFGELQKTVELDPSNYDALAKLGEIYVAAGMITEGSRIADNLVKSRPQAPDGYLIKSGVAVRTGKIDESIEHLRKAVELDPKRIRTLLTLGNLYLLRRDAKSAMRWYDNALATEPNAPEVHLSRGNFFFASGALEDGEKAYRRAIELSRDKEGLRIALAEHYLFQGRIEDSEKELTAVINELNSKKGRKVLAEIRIETGKVAEAKGLVDAILKENEKDLDGKYLKGRIALAEKRLNDAKALFAEAVAQDAGSARARLFNGLADILLGRVEVGKSEIQEAVKLDPANVKAHLVLGDLHLKSNAPAEAEKEALEVLRRNPSNIQAAVLYGDTFLLRKDYKRAERIYGEVVRELPRSPVGYLKMGLSRKHQKKPAEAASFFEQAVERSPTDVTAVNEYVFALAASGKSDKALKTLDGCIAEAPKNPLLWEMAGRFHLASRKQEEAEMAFLRAIELAPDFVRPYYELGVLYSAQRKLPHAEVKFRKAVEKDNTSVGAHTLLGVVLNSLGKVEEANRHYRRSLELSPKNALAANNLASNLSENPRDLDEALRFAQVARETAPDDPNVADTLGWIYYKKGLYQIAYPLIADAAKRADRNAVIRFHHGMVLLKKAGGEMAATELKAALAMDPKFPGADVARATLAALK